MMDEDGSGSLTLDELINGFQNNEEFRDALTMMELNEDDLEIVFKIMDNDRSGALDYHEFVDELQRMQKREMHMLLVFIKYYVQQIREKIARRITAFEENMGKYMKTLGSTSNMGGQHMHRPHMPVTLAVPEDKAVNGEPAGHKLADSLMAPLGPLLNLESASMLSQHALREELDTLMSKLRQELSAVKVAVVAEVRKGRESPTSPRSPREQRRGLGQSPRGNVPNVLGTSPRKTVVSPWAPGGCCAVERSKHRQSLTGQA